MLNKKEEEILEEYIAIKNFRPSLQRKQILKIFLSIDKHLTADELFRIAKEKYPNIGFATVYRTLRLFCDCGLCRELRFEDGTTRYEHQYGHQHHDHLICTKCGKFVEVVDPDIERLQEKLFNQYEFYPQRHKMELYGICKKCSK
ncbi:transcriptional repressor [Candidatus Poribacteria bacterium]|nr:transcriptional repressor [Candidatus Poribacteria bacterium]